jgi:hypothetical protein
MDTLEQIARAGMMLVGLGIVVVLIAAAFMIVFKIATGIDDQIQE